jgi:hypothetical protein
MPAQDMVPMVIILPPIIEPPFMLGDIALAVGAVAAGTTGWCAAWTFGSVAHTGVAAKAARTERVLIVEFMGFPFFLKAAAAGRGSSLSASTQISRSPLLNLQLARVCAKG